MRLENGDLLTLTISGNHTDIRIGDFLKDQKRGDSFVIERINATHCLQVRATIWAKIKIFFRGLFK